MRRFRTASPSPRRRRRGPCRRAPAPGGPTTAASRPRTSVRDSFISSWRWLPMTAAACWTSAWCWRCASSIACWIWTFGSAYSSILAPNSAIRYLQPLTNGFAISAVLSQPSSYAPVDPRQAVRAPLRDSCRDASRYRRMPLHRRRRARRRHAASGSIFTTARICLASPYAFRAIRADRARGRSDRDGVATTAVRRPDVARGAQRRLERAVLADGDRRRRRRPRDGVRCGRPPPWAA